MSQKQQRTLHKIAKQLDREMRHRAWLEQNLKHSQQVKNSRKKVLLLYTELATRNAEQKKLNHQKTNQSEGLKLAEFRD